jgi:hypothetical protein
MSDPPTSSSWVFWWPISGSLSVLIKVLTLFCHSHSVLHSFWCLLRVHWFELELILARQVLSHLSQSPCPLHRHPLNFQLISFNGIPVWFDVIPGMFPWRQGILIILLQNIDHSSLVVGYVCQLHIEALSCVWWHWLGRKLLNQYDDLK